MADALEVFLLISVCLDADPSRNTVTLGLVGVGSLGFNLPFACGPRRRQTSRCGAVWAHSTVGLLFLPSPPISLPAPRAKGTPCCPSHPSSSAASPLHHHRVMCPPEPYGSHQTPEPRCGTLSSQWTPCLRLPDPLQSRGRHKG